MNVERNIKLTYLNFSLDWARFYIPVIALFYIASQMTLEEFGIIMSVFSLSILLLEIPTGIVTDMIGKKKALIIARVSFLIEIIIISFFNGFLAFLIAKIISGVGVSFNSGTNEGMIYDSLKRIRKEEDYKHVKANLELISNSSKAVVFVLGAYLFTINPKLPAIISIPFMALRS